jgi:hypothetical protein
MRVIVLIQFPALRSTLHLLSARPWRYVTYADVPDKESAVSDEATAFWNTPKRFDKNTSYLVLPEASTTARPVTDIGGLERAIATGTLALRILFGALVCEASMLDGPKMHVMYPR